MGEARAGVVDELGRDREQLTAVPVDDLRQGIHDAQRPHPAIAQGGDGGVAETESADEDIPLLARDRRVDRGEAEVGEGLLRDGE